MADTGAKYPGSGTNDASVGTFAWTNPGNITADDGSYASAPAVYESCEYRYERVSLVDSSGSVTPTNKAVFPDNVPFPTTGFEYQSFGGVSDTWDESLTPSYINSSNFGVVVQANRAGAHTNYLKASDFGFSIPDGSVINGVIVEPKTYNFPQDIGNCMYQARIDTIRITVYYSMPTVPHFLKQQNGRLLFQQSGRGILL